MNIHQHDTLVDRLDAQSDDDLRALIGRAREILAGREDKRRKEAIAAIRKLAAEHGLDVAVKRPARRRGRPPKPKSA